MPSDARPVHAHLQEIVFPDHANHLGTLFGGQALAWMDKAAFIAASRHARRTVVTARSEQVDFRRPIRQGQLVEVEARIVSVGTSAMQVEVELHAEDLLAGERVLCTRGRFTMVALDAQGRPAAVPPIPGRGQSSASG
ncbi:acyl-CoA thioesterase [Thermomonas sp.]|uniref:acyl-CoA thioesterase n=1 Tax=Thermomonas sp. TaxID=1971895 RepID=UPI003D1194D9